MSDIIFVVPSVLNRGGGETRIPMSVSSLQEAFVQAVGRMGDDFGRRVLESDGKPRALINVYVNGKNAKFSGGMSLPLSDGDEVYILPAVAGGQQEFAGRELDSYTSQIMLAGAKTSGAVSRHCDLAGEDKPS